MKNLYEKLAKKSFRVVGTKQVLKGLDAGDVRCVIIANDCEDYLKNVLVETAKDHNVQIEFIESMDLLKELCGVDVKTATAGLI